MIFSLEALQAFHGDSLLVHAGTTAEPVLLLVDGGPSGTWETSLQPRLEELRAERAGDGALQIDLAMVSHIDDDHIGGLLALVEDTDGGLGLPHTSWVSPKALWHNTFEELTGDLPAQALSLGEVPASATAAVVASVQQGQDLRARAEVLGWPINKPFTGLVQAPAGAAQPVALDQATSLLVTDPRAEEVASMRKEWKKQLEKLKKGEKQAAEVAAYVDKSPTNLSSIVCLARQGERKILLTGDARGDLILKALDIAGVTTAGKLHVDILKIPHHGSIRDLDADFFERITADHYVISADGRFGNPESKTLEFIADTRTDDAFAIHLTYASGHGDLQQRLEQFIAERDTAKRKFEVVSRTDPDLALTIDLGDPPFA
jgi:beta-lactamase superfamily II metal-dependent hydrolase